MKLILVTAVMSILLSSCLKQSIPDAMLAKENSGGQGNVTATLSYKVNGNAVSLTVPDAESQDPNSYTLGCTKFGGYIFDAVTSTGEFTYNFFSDSLTVGGHYSYFGSYGDMFFIDYNGQDEYAHYAADSMSFNVTSYKNGLISGNFSGQLSPLVSASTINNVYGAPGSVLITNGSFQNVPVFY